MRREWLRHAFAAGLCLAGCGPGADPNAANTPQVKPGQSRWKIVCTVGMVTDIVQRIAGEHATVQGLFAAGVDPHLRSSTAHDTGLMMQADLVFFSGLHLEGRMVEDLEAGQKRGRPFYPVTADLLPEDLITSEVAMAHDPHVWGDVRLWIKCARTIADRLKRFDPPHANDYQANLDRLSDEMAQLDDYIRQAMASIPESQRVLVTAHDAFGYFSRAYAIQVRSVQGISTDSEAGVNDINSLVDMLVEKQIPTVFVEASVNPKSLEAVREGAAHQGWKVSVGGTLYSDSMGPPETYEGTYLGMMDANATMIARTLGGKVPAGGWQGKLRTP